MNALLQFLARLVPPFLAKRLGASGWGDRAPATPGQPRGAELRLWARSGSRCWPGEWAPASSDFLLPEFHLHGPLTSVWGSGEARLLTINLLQGASLVSLGERRVRLHGKPLHVRGPALPLPNSRCFPCPGRYCLVACLDEQEVARFNFRLVGDAELAQATRVSGISINAQKRDGRVTPGLRVLRWPEHVAALPSFRIETPVPAPNTLVHCSAQTFQGSLIVASEEFLLPLDRPARQVRLRRLDLAHSALAVRTKPARLTLSVQVAGELKAVLPFLLLPADQVANAEGQLTQDAKDLPLDDLEYEQIMNALALPVPPQPSRRLWR